MKVYFKLKGVDNPYFADNISKIVFNRSLNEIRFHSFEKRRRPAKTTYNKFGLGLVGLTTFPLDQVEDLETDY